MAAAASDTFCLIGYLSYNYIYYQCMQPSTTIRSSPLCHRRVSHSGRQTLSLSSAVYRFVPGVRCCFQHVSPYVVSRENIIINVRDRAPLSGPVPCAIGVYYLAAGRLHRSPARFIGLFRLSAADLQQQLHDERYSTSTRCSPLCHWHIL